MNCVRKNIAAIILLAMVLLPSLFSIYTIIRQQQLRHEMQELIELENMETITLTPAEIQWIKKDKEILVQGKMFDVKTIRTINGKIVITGIFDEKETELAKTISAMLDSSTDSSPETGSQFFFFSFYPADDTENIQYNIHNISEKKFDHYNRLTCTITLALNTPPPDAA